MKYLLLALVPVFVIAGARVWDAVHVVRLRSELLREEFHEEALSRRELAFY